MFPIDALRQSQAEVTSIFILRLLFLPKPSGNHVDIYSETAIFLPKPSSATYLSLIGISLPVADLY